MTEQQKLTKATYHLYTFLVSKMIGSLGANVYTFGISLYILSITGSALSFATNMIFSILPRTIISPIAGMLSDRIPRKILVLGGQAGVIATISGLAIYTAVFDLSLTAIYIATACMSIFSSFNGVAFTASISNLVDEDRLQKAMSFNQLSVSIAGIGGPIIGGMLYGFVSMEVFLIAFIVTEIIGFVLESTMNFSLYKKEKTESAKSETMVQSFKAGVVYLKQQKVLSAIIITALWLNFFFTATSVGSSYVAVTLLKIPSTYIGFIEAAGAIGMLGASIIFATRSNVKYPLLVSKRSILLMSISVALIAVPLMINFSALVTFIYFFGLFLAFGVLGVVTNTPIGVVLQKSVDEEYRGRVFGIVEMLSMGMMPLGTIIYGFLFDRLPAEYVLITTAICLIGVTLYFLRGSVIHMAYPELKEAKQVKQSLSNHAA